MPRVNSPKSLMISLAGLALLALWLTGGHAHGIAQDKKESVQKTARLTRIYYGVKACSNAGCHSSKPDQKDYVCRCTEVLTWQKEDKHKNANTVLTKKRSQDMAKLLRVKGDISKQA